VQAEEFHDSIRPGLIAMLPRLKRFADLLVGARKEGTALLRRALQLMLAEEHRYQRGTALDRWAFAEIYRLWLAELRGHADPVAQAKADDASFAQLFRDEDGEPFDNFTTSFLRSLRHVTIPCCWSMATLPHIDGRVLDVVRDDQRAVVRISASLADRLRTGDSRKRHRRNTLSEVAS
jgi:RNA polymerase sigma-70 factor (ECF subfamily)